MDSHQSPNPLLAFLLRSRPRSRLFDLHDSNTQQLLRDYAVREFNALLWLSLIVVTAVLLRKVVRVFRLWIEGSRIPGPPCPSIYGHYKLVRDGNLTGVLTMLHEKYGSVVKLWLGPTQLLVSIKDRELVKDMLWKAEDKVPLVGRAFQLAFGRSSLFMTSFDEVHKRRELLAAELNHRWHVRSSAVPNRVVDSVMEKIHLESTKGSLRCKALAHHMAFSLMGSVVFGEAFFKWSHAAVYEDILMSIAKDVCFWASFTVTPFWKHGFWRYQRLCKKLKSLTSDVVHLCRSNYEQLCSADWKQSNDSRDVRSSLVCSHAILADDLLFEDVKKNLYSREEPCANVMGVMFHGCLTTGGLISNMLARLAARPGIQDQIHEEIIRARKGLLKDGCYSIDEMPLLVATIYESARLLPAWPLLQRCSLYNDFRLKSGTVIPAGTVLVVPLNLIHTDGSSWGNDANDFNPYRFLSCTSSGSAQFRGAKEDYLRKNSYILEDPNNNKGFFPFGSGMRACVGQKIVVHGVATLFASLLEHYEIKLQEGNEHEDDLEPLLNMEIVLTERNSS